MPKKPRLNIKHEKYITDKRKREAKFNRSLKKMNEMCSNLCQTTGVNVSLGCSNVRENGAYIYNKYVYRA